MSEPLVQGLVVHQFHSGTAEGDAITRQMLRVRDALRALGCTSEIFAEHVAPALADDILDIREYEGHPDQVLLVHHSMGHDALGDILALPDRLVTVYHNITPEQHISDDVTRYYSRIGRQQLAVLAERCGAGIADSNFNRQDMLDLGFRRVTVIPAYTDFSSFRAPDWLPAERSGNWLFVGRVVPNKGQLELVEAFARYARHHDPVARLVLVGDDRDRAYVERVQRRAFELGLPDRVVLAGKLSHRELVFTYHRSSLFVSLSEHEGFGVPLLEAMAAGIPVIGLATTAVPETMGGAGVLVHEKEPTQLAALAEVILSDEELRSRIVARQFQRVRQVEDFDLPSALSGVLEQVSSGSKALTVQVQGPFETSYSLAVLNRHVAEELDRADGVEVSIYATEGPGDYDPDPADVALHPVAAELHGRAAAMPYPDVVIRQMYPPRVHDSNGGLTCQYFGWEESRLPSDYVEQFNRHLDGIGTMSEYVAQLLIDSGVRVPVAAVGVGVEPHDDTIIPDQPELTDLPSFRFLNVGSALPRKGLDVLLRAYFERFTGADDVTLVLKTFPNPHNDVGEQLARLRAQTPNPPDVRWIDRDLPAAQLTALFNIASCYVHTARGEGFGLPVAEAMLAEVPVIAVAHAGLADFCSEATVRTVPFTIEPAQTHVSVQGSTWAEPDRAVLGDLLRAEFDGADPAGRAERVRLAKALIEAEYTWDAVGRRWRAFLDRVELGRADPKVALVTTFNSRCGIAEYSKYLVRHARDVRYELYSDRAVEPLDPEVELGVDRRWDQRWRPDLADLRAALDRSAAEVVHIQFNFGFFELSRLQALIEHQLAQRDVVLTLHSTRDVTIGDEQVSLANIGDTLAKVSAIVVHQDEDARRLASFGVVDNVLVMAHGTRVPVARDRDALRRDLGLADRTIIGTFGFLVPHKGTLDLIRAIDLLRHQFPETLLLSVSALHPDPSSAAYLAACRDEIETRGLAAHVTLVTDFLPDDEASALLSAADVIVLPYKQTQESVSGALRFVLPIGRPTVVSDLPIFADVRHAIDVVADTSPEGLAEKLGKLLADDAGLDRLVTQAEAFAHETSWDLIAREHRALYVSYRRDRSFDRVPLEADVERRRADCV